MSRFNVPPHPQPFSLREKGATAEAHRQKGVTAESHARPSPSPLRERAGVRAKITKQLSKNLRQNQTKAEVRIWRHLKSRALAGYKFRRQCPIGPYIVDFVRLEKMIVIEIDGGQHAEQLKEDARRTAYLNYRGFEVLKFWNNEVLANTDTVLSIILTALVSSPSSPALLPDRMSASAHATARLPLPSGEGMRVRMGEGSGTIPAQSVNGICTADEKYSPSPNGRGQG